MNKTGQYYYFLYLKVFYASSGLYNNLGYFLQWFLQKSKKK